MSPLTVEHVTHVHHWNESLFSFRTTRDRTFRFESGHFTMIGIAIEGRPLLRAYSIVSAHYDDHLEFFSIKVPDGVLTSRLQHLKVGDEVFVSRKSTGTLVLSDLRPGRRLYLLGTGTGLAPFISIIRDPAAFERFENVILVHAVRQVSDLAYADYINCELPQHEFLGDDIRAKFIYYPTVTREPFRNRGRLTDLITNGTLFDDTGLPPLDAAHDRAMICGNATMLKETTALLDARGFTISPRIGHTGDYVIERAFVE